MNYHWGSKKIPTKLWPPIFFVEINSGSGCILIAPTNYFILRIFLWAFLFEIYFHKNNDGLYYVQFSFRPPLCNFEISFPFWKGKKLI